MDGERRLPPDGDGSLDGQSLLRDPRHRRLLAVLVDRDEPLTVGDLAIELTVAETGSRPADISTDDYREIRTDLSHRCLPKLESVGWIERHHGAIVASDSLPFGTGGPLPDPTAHDDQFWAAVDALLAQPRRQPLASTLADHDSLSIDELAAELATHSSWPTDRRDEESTPVILLHHVDLPKLAAAGLVTYDPDGRTVRPTDRLRTLDERVDFDALDIEVG